MIVASKRTGDEQMTFGTSYFKDFAAAVRYYREMGLNSHHVTRKLKEGEIHIGRPPIDYSKGERSQLHPKEGRYFVTTRA
jgi:hypothetical protein